MPIAPVPGGAGASPQVAALDLPLWFPDSKTGTWGVATAAGQMGGTVYSNTAAQAVNDQVTYNSPLVAGTYSIMVFAFTASGAGIITIKDGATTLGTVDLYSGSPVANALTTLTGKTIATSGLHAIQLIMATKNASSSGFNCYLTQVHLTRTGA